MVIRIQVLSFLMFSSLFSFAQQENWHLKDFQQDGYKGISLIKAYEFLKQSGREPKKVVVAVIDSGIDTAHADLKNILWRNPKELLANGKDDDKNGYVDDVYGWNFLGSSDKNKNVEKDSNESERVYWKYKDRFEGINPRKVGRKDQYLYQSWLRAEKELDKKRLELKNGLLATKDMLDQGLYADSVLKIQLNKSIYSFQDLKDYKTNDPKIQRFITSLNSRQKNDSNKQTSNIDQIEFLKRFLIVRESQKIEEPKDYRAIVADSYANIKDRFYGNQNLTVSNSSAFHGTHVAGIIAAERGNGLGIDGIVDAEIMSLRVVPDGDEHDKDIALAIRYAADHGASVINMSFGKAYSPEKKWVDDAVKYAQKKGVLLVHAAGNSAQNIDTTFNYPTHKFLNGKAAPNWITVGASGDKKIGGLVASFSNYGKESVDVFAPGVQVYSTVPGPNGYGPASGTSMAAPVVSGVAALLFSYYPDLNYKQVKYILEETAVKPLEDISVPKTKVKARLSDISKTGGIVNAYEAVKLAEEISKGKLKR